MFELVRGLEPVTDAAGVSYRARVYGRAEPGGRWSGWLVFFPVPPGPVISSGRETVQPSYDDLVRWGTSLSHVYLEGALRRALTLQPEAALADDLARLYLLAQDAREEAELAEASAKIHEISADVDRVRAGEAERSANEIAATAASVEEAEAAAVAKAHENAAELAREQAKIAGRRKQMAKAAATGKPATPRRRKQRG